MANGKVKQAREEAGLTIAELADKSGLSKSTIYDLEQKNKKPLFHTMCKIADALDKDLDDFR